MKSFDKTLLANPSFFDRGSEVRPDKSAELGKVGDLAIVRVSYLPYSRGQVVRLLSRNGSDWMVRYVKHVEGNWVGPDGVTRHCDNQTPLFSGSSLELITESDYAASQKFMASLQPSLWQRMRNLFQKDQL